MQMNVNMESVAKTQKSDAVTVNIELLMEGVLFKGKPERCRNIK